eukprot:12597938-Alexandrium_andersonii.AAC.1
MSSPMRAPSLVGRQLAGSARNVYCANSLRLRPMVAKRSAGEHARGTNRGAGARRAHGEVRGATRAAL